MAQKSEKFSRRQFLHYATLAAGGAGLAACAPLPAAAPAPATQATEAPKEAAAPAGKIKLEILSYDADEVHKKAFQLFMDAHPEVDMLWSPVPGDWNDLLAKVNTRIAAGNAPDMCAVATYGPCITWAKKGLLVDLNDLVAADADMAKGPIPQGLLDRYVQAGHLFGIPKDYVSHAVIYNKTIFDKAGIEPPKDGWLWSDLMDMATQLTSGEGTEKQYGWMTPTGPWQNEPWLIMNGGKGFFDRRKWDFTTPTAADPKNIEALQWLVDTILVSKVSPSAEQLQAQDASSRQLSGRMAMWASHTIDTVVLLKNTDKIDWYVVPFPRAFKGGETSTMLWTSGFGIISSTKYVDKCWEFLKHFSIGEGAKVLGTTGFSIPSGVPEAFLTPEMVKRGGQTFLDVTNADVPINDTLGVNHSEMTNNVLTPHFEAAFLGKETPEEALQAVQKGMEDVLAANPEK